MLYNINIYVYVKYDVNLKYIMYMYIIVNYYKKFRGLLYGYCY